MKPYQKKPSFFFQYLITLVFLFSLFTPGTYAEEKEKSSLDKSGILELRGEYKIFPYNKPGNTVYYKEKKLISKENISIQDIIEVAEGIVYLGIDEAGEMVLSFAGDPEVEFELLEGGFYRLKDRKNGLSKLFRVDLNGQIKDLLPKSKTASGLAYNGKNKAAFFHIAKGELIEFEDGRSRYQYTFRIHIVRAGSSIIRTLQEPVKDFSIKLSLRWKNPNTLHVVLGNGEKKVYHL